MCALVQEGYLPLHYAAENNAELQVVTALLKAYPVASKAKNDNFTRQSTAALRIREAS